MINKTEITISKQKLSILLLIKFRYSLNRHTYIVSDCCEDLKQYWSLMCRNYREQIINDLEHYFTDLKHEHKCDIDEWRKMLEFAKLELNSKEENDK